MKISLRPVGEGQGVRGRLFSREHEMKIFSLVLAIVSIFFIAACASAAPPPTGSTNAQAAPISLGDDVLVIYNKRGGIAGLNETLLVHQGSLLQVKMTDGTTKTAKVAEPQMQPVRRMLEQKEFSELAPLYQAVGADLISYTITARDANGNPKTVTTMDGAHPPPYLEQLIVMLDQLRAQVK